MKDASNFRRILSANSKAKKVKHLKGVETITENSFFALFCPKC